MKLQDIISAVQEYFPEADIELLRKAHAFVKHHHQGQTRASGEPYLTHVTNVAFLATKLRLDMASIITALLHDVVEDTDATIEEIEKEFGPTVARLVDAVTKLSRVNFRSRMEAQAENFRKMLVAMASDIRVLLIKLCDRTHNMRTLEYLSESRRLRISQETLDIYAPLAHRLGIYWMKSELEDLAFRHLKPELYENIKQKIRQKRNEREKYIKDVVELINTVLEANNIHAQVSGRPKHFFSILQKMERQGLDFEEIYDLIAFRIIVENTMQCYAALGVLHAAWKPIPGRFKDYVAMPKPNKYQSLHTTVIGPEGMRIEIQIRTTDMHDVAERGIAAHWKYKEGKGGSELDESQLQYSWLNDLVESQKALKDPNEFMINFKGDLFPDEVFVFSPKGEVFALKVGATPIDFAFNIHTDVGKHCVGARVNGRQVPLNYRLRNGDTVEIVTSKQQLPSKDWLDYVVTSKAAQRIRAFTKQDEREKSIAVGKELLTKDLKKLKKSFPKVEKNGDLAKVAEDLGFKDIDMMLAEIGYGKMDGRAVLEKLYPQEEDLDRQLSREQTAIEKIFKSAAKVFKDQGGIKISGMNDVVFRFAHCCEPLPGDELVGYITRGRGVTVHARGCAQTMKMDPQRLVTVTWDEDVNVKRRIKVDVLCNDKVGMLADMSRAISGVGANIVSAHAGPKPDGKAVITFEVSVESIDQLDAIRRALEGLDGIIRVERTKRVSTKHDAPQDEYFQ